MVSRGESAVGLLNSLAVGFQGVMRSHHSSSLELARSVEFETRHRSEICDRVLRLYPGQVELVYHFRALSALVKNLARLCIDFSVQGRNKSSAFFESLDKSTGFLGDLA